MWNSKRTLLIVMVCWIIVVPVSQSEGDGVLSSRELLRAVHEDDNPNEEPPGLGTERVQVRILHFPRNRSLGKLWVFTGTPEESEITPLSMWRLDDHLREDLGQAKGDVAVPTDKPIHLIISGPSQDLSPLARLRPSDLYMLTIRGSGQRVHNPDETIMPYLSGLKGLEFLNISYLNITRRGLRHIRGLKSLKGLTLTNTPRIGNAALAMIASELPPLEGLALFSDSITDQGLLHIAKMNSLEELLLCAPRVRGPGLAHLAKAPSLKYLTLAGGNKNFGDAHMRYLSGNTSLTKLTLHGCPVTDVGMIHLANLTNLEELHFIRRFGQRITEKGLAHLSKLPKFKRLENIKKVNAIKYLTLLTHLEYLNFNIEPGEDEDQVLALLGKFKSLKSLKVEGASDKVLALSVQFKELESLELEGDRITDAGLEHLAKLTSLRELRLKANTITNVGLSHLVKLKSLEVLHLEGDHITDAGMAHIARITNLWQLSLDGPLTDDGLSHLSHMSQLRELGIGDEGRFTDSGLSYLQRMKGLRWLRITRENKYSPEAVRRLKSNLPHIRKFEVRQADSD